MELGLLIFLAVFGQIGAKSKENQETTINITTGCIFTESSCIMECSHLQDNIRDAIILTLMNYQMKELFQHAECSLISAIKIQNSTFRYKMFDETTLANTKLGYELEISDSDLQCIQPESFNSPEFDLLFSLQLRNVNIPFLEGGILLGLANLEFLTIVSPMNYISRSFFQPVATTLRHLKLSGMVSSISLGDLFGVSEMAKLKTLDLSNNNFGTLNEKAILQNLPVLHSLNLSKSKIGAITADIFSGIAEHLESLDLSENLLTTITAQIFYSVVNDQRTFIYLGENDWVCDCGLKDFNAFYEKHRNMFIDLVLCKNPPEFEGQFIYEVKLVCGNESVVPTTEMVISDTTGNPVTATSIGSSSEKPPVTEDDWIAGLVPEFPKRNDSVQFTCTSRKQKMTTVDFLYVAPPQYEFSIALDSEDAVRITIQDFDRLPVVLWFDDNQIHGPRSLWDDVTDCRLYEDNFVVIEDLAVNVTYTFCLIPLGESFISPLNCQPFYIPALSAEHDQVWLTTDYKALIISLYCLIVVTCFFLGGFLSYLVVKEYPTLLKGSEHVFIVQDSIYERIPSKRRKGSATSSIYSIQKSPPPPYVIYEAPLYEDVMKIKALETIPDADSCPNSPPPIPKRNLNCSL